MKPETNPKKPKVISYLRWSTAGQKLGDSERRQLEAADKWLKENGYELDEKQVIEDDGKSGYHSENFSENGALGQFATKVKNGEIPKGTILLIEDFSRFSRAKVSLAQERFLSLVNNHIVIHMLRDNKTYDQSNDFSDFFLSMVKMQAAHEESDRKASHLKRFWEGRREDAKEASIHEKKSYPVYLPSNSPDWLRKVSKTNPDGKSVKYFEVIEEYKKTIEYIFHLADKGGEDGLGLGSTRIVRQLENEGIKPFIGERKNTARTFNDSYILRLINDRRLIGELQPYRNPIDEETGKRIRVKEGEPIPHYFPPVIDEELFLRVQQKVKQRKLYQSGKISRKFSNLFTKLVKCAYCGAPMTMFQKRGSKAEGGKCAYLQCSEGTKLMNKEKCGNRSVRYFDTFEKTIISTLVELDLRPLFENKNDKDNLRKIKVRDDLISVRTKLDKVNQQIKNATILQIDYPDDRDIAEQKVLLREEKSKLELQIEELNHELLMDGRDLSYETFRDNLDFVSKSIDPEDDLKTYTKRRAINTYLMDILQYIAIDSPNQECWIVFDLGHVKRKLLASFAHEIKPEPYTLDKDGNPITAAPIPSETDIKAFGTSPIEAHLKVKLHRFNLYEPDALDIRILRTSYDVAPPELIKINKICDGAINRNWKHLRRARYQVLDQNMLNELYDSLLPPELLELDDDIEYHSDNK